jgi:predicted dehydrogenase
VSTVQVALEPPRLGFLGVGWIGRHRLDAVAASGAATVAAVCDADAARATEVAMAAAGARAVASLDALLEAGVDGVVIATPSALHAAQAVRALEAGAAVFCQKPLARTAAEAQRVVDAARAADRLLAVDYCYRELRASRQLRERVQAGAYGRVYALDLVFHNAYGPDRAWSRDPALAGGGCLMDLGTHLVDLALWLLDFPRVESAAGRLLAGGEPLVAGAPMVEDFATAELALAGGVHARLACSWEAHAGRDAVVEVRVHGTAGGAALRNVAGSFHDFRLEEYQGTMSRTLVEPPDAWGGRAITGWARRLAADPSFHPECAHAVTVSAALDRIHGR